MLRYRNGRLEFVNLDGDVVGVFPPEAMTEEERAEGVEVLPVDDHTRQSFERYRAGDTGAGDELSRSLQAANQQTAAVVRDSVTRGQPNTAPLTTQPGEKVGVLQTPDFLNAQLNVAETALNTEDAFQKLGIEEAGVVRAAREAGLGDLFTPEYFKGRYGDIQNGMNGPFPASPQEIQTRLNSAQANDPAYINYINRIGGITAAAEINRRQNILADAKQKIAGAATQKERLQSSDDLIRELRYLDEDRARAVTDITNSSADNYAAQRGLDKLERDTQVKRERLEAALWRSMADADPARAVAYFEGMTAPKSGNALFGTGETITTPQPSTSKGPPAEGINLAAAYGTRDRFGELTYPGRENGIFTTPTPQASPAAAPEQKPDQPPYTAPPGQRWVNEMGRWVLKDIKEYEPLETPAFAEGGYYGEPGTGSYYGGGGEYGYAPPPPAPAPTAPPAAGAMTQEGAAAPPGDPSTTPAPTAAEEANPLGSDTTQPDFSQEQSAEYYSILGQIHQIRQQAAAEQRAVAMEHQKVTQQKEIMHQQKTTRLLAMEQRAIEAAAALQQRLQALETQVRQAAAENPYVMRQIARIQRPGLPTAEGILEGWRVAAYGQQSQGQPQQSVAPAPV